MLLRRYHIKPVEDLPKEKPVLDNMTVTKLKEYAAANNIPLGNARSKADILAVINHVR